MADPQKLKSIKLLILDVDNFKQINDTYGHDFGNTVLKRIAGIIKDNSRRCDTVARYGGEEICVIMPGSGPQEALKQAERIREEISKFEFGVTRGEVASVTVSGGLVSTEKSRSYNYTDLINRADKALYASKMSGKNRITSHRAAVADQSW